MGNKGEDTCQQLNCYRGFDDAIFRSNLQEMKTKLDGCQPEQDAAGQEQAALTQTQTGQAESLQPQTDVTQQDNVHPGALGLVVGLILPTLRTSIVVPECRIRVQCNGAKFL